MNNRIKEFKIIAWDYACGKIPPNALGQNNHEDYFAEKFAELLIRECIDVANSHFESKDTGYPGDRIQEHFGIKS